MCVLLCPHFNRKSGRHFHVYQFCVEETSCWKEEALSGDTDTDSAFTETQVQLLLRPAAEGFLGDYVLLLVFLSVSKILHEPEDRFYWNCQIVFTFLTPTQLNLVLPTDWILTKLPANI